MKYESKKNMLVGILIIALVSLTVAFAALYTTLNISNTATVANQSWNVKIDGWSKDSNTGTGVTVTSGTITDTSITGYKFDFSEPGTSITYNFYIKNYGTIDAKINDVTVGTPTCRVSGSTISPCPVTYSVVCDGNTLSTGSTSSMKKLLGSNNGTPVSGGISTCTYTVSYNDYNYDIDDDITVENLDVSWQYEQD